MTGSVDHAGDKLPLGEPRLAWSLNRDGEAKPGLVERRDHQMKLNSSKKRRNRADLVPLAKPQVGVDALKGVFPHAAIEMPGVSDAQRLPR
jgi:hypothetical protein